MPAAAPVLKKAEDNKKDASFQEELAKNMGTQMKYVMPVMMFFIAQSLAALVSLYLITSSVFAVGQELYMRRKIKKEDGY
jgi:membrane protein insertase Oxa1/YidC/SpoIIIJ